MEISMVPRAIESHLIRLEAQAMYAVRSQPSRIAATDQRRCPRRREDQESHRARYHRRRSPAVVTGARESERINFLAPRHPQQGESTAVNCVAPYPAAVTPMQWALSSAGPSAAGLPSQQHAHAARHTDTCQECRAHEAIHRRQGAVQPLPSSTPGGARKAAFEGNAARPLHILGPQGCYYA